LNPLSEVLQALLNLCSDLQKSQNTSKVLQELDQTLVNQDLTNLMIGDKVAVELALNKVLLLQLNNIRKNNKNNKIRKKNSKVVEANIKNIEINDIKYLCLYAIIS
jgi:hypothetical protein